MQITSDTLLYPIPLRRALYRLLWWPPLRGFLGGLPLVNRLYRGWQRIHPFDIDHRIDASGFVSAAECAGESVLAGKINPYGGSQPSIVRASLAMLPDIQRYAFVDLGCGKGRPLVVASEFPFKRVVGIELAPALAEIARANSGVIAKSYPGRTAIDIEIGDASAPPAPADRVVFFMYNAFDGDLIHRLVQSIEGQLAGPLKHAFFVYYNPVHSAVVDRSASFARWSVRTIPYAADELGYGPDIEDTVLIWQSLPSRYPSKLDAGKAVAVGATGWTRLVDAG